jgi:hypothetical protein
MQYENEERTSWHKYYSGRLGVTENSTSRGQFTRISESKSVEKSRDIPRGQNSETDSHRVKNWSEVLKSDTLGLGRLGVSRGRCSMFTLD